MPPQSAGDPKSAFLEQQYEPGGWRGTNRLAENLFVWRFLFTGRELPDWRAERRRNIAVAGVPPLTRSMWRGAGDTAISVEVFECVSRLAAHQQVVEILGNIESTAIRRDDGELGDVAFITPTRTLALFARANLVVFMRNADTQVGPVYETALGFDRQIIERPAPGGLVIPEIRRLALSTPDQVYVGEPAPLEVAAEDPLGSPVRYSIWSRIGDVRLEDGTLVYEAPTAGTDVITVYTVNEAAGAATAELNVEVQPRE